MYKTCNGCKALDIGIGRQATRCILGYKIQEDKRHYGIILSYKPLEDCLKPKTLTDLIYLQMSSTRT